MNGHASTFTLMYSSIFESFWRREKNENTLWDLATFTKDCKNSEKHNGSEIGEVTLEEEGSSKTEGMKNSSENSKKLKLHLNSDYNAVGLKSANTIHECDICDVSFPEKEAFDVHFKKFHADEELYSCDICNDKFPQKNYLDLHNGKVHEEENPFICDDCKCGFAEENYFRNHFCMIPCSICNKIFEGKNSLKTHIATVHEGKKPFIENKKVQEEKDIFENRFPQVGKDEKQQIYSGSELEEEYTNIKADLYEYSGKEKGLKRQ